MSVFTRFFGRAVSDAAGFAAGVAVAPALHPVVQEVVNHAWELHPVRPPDAAILAVGVAQGKVDEDSARQWAHETGFGDPQFDALVGIATAAPALGEAYRAWRRDKLTDAEMRQVFKRHGIADEWLDALMALKQDVLDEAQLANAIHRGLIPDPGLLAVEPPTGTGNVPAYPTYDIDALTEAAASGLDRERLGVLVGLTGLPMGAHEAAQAVFRHVLTQTDYARAIAEGNTRNEWGDAIMEQSRQIPTARDFLENALRGYRTLPEAIQGAALHGMTPEHATMIYQNQGRPMNVRQITQALARGGKFQPEPGEITDPYRASIVEGNLKPAYYDLADALKYTLPSVFAIRQLATSGVWGEAKVRERLEWWGWNPEDAADVATAWTGGGASKADAHIGKAQSQLWTTTHTAYKNAEADEARARENMAALDIPDAAQDTILTFWNLERATVRKQLTLAQIKTAYRDALMSRDEVTEALNVRGYSVADTTMLLGEWDHA